MGIWEDEAGGEDEAGVVNAFARYTAGVGAYSRTRSSDGEEGKERLAVGLVRLDSVRNQSASIAEHVHP